MARSDIKYTKPSDLIGKTVGVPGINSVIDVMFRKWLINNHVPLDKVKVVEGPLPQLPDMLKSNSVDYVAIVEPLRTRIVATKIGYNAAEYFAEVNPDVLVSGWLASARLGEEESGSGEEFPHLDRRGPGIHPRRIRTEAKTIEKKFIGYNSPSFPDLQQPGAAGRSDVLPERRQGIEAVPHAARSQEDRRSVTAGREEKT